MTDELWKPGEIVSLTLQRKGPLARTPEHRFSLQARAVRRDQHGVGVSFELSPDAELQLWQGPPKRIEEHAEPEQVLREFRIAAAIAFLRRICPAAAKEIKHLLREKLSSYRLEIAVEIALHAEEMLVFEPGARKMRAHPRLVMRIIEDGSWAENDRIQQFWAGLLATCCTLGNEDVSNQAFLDLIGQLTGVQTRIFAYACTMATTFQSESGDIAADPLICSAEEIVQIAGILDMAKIDRDLEHLADLGLLVQRENQSLFSLLADADITPTCVGLDLYARCNAHRGTAQDFYGPFAVPAIAAP